MGLVLVRVMATPRTVLDGLLDGHGLGRTATPAANPSQRRRPSGPRKAEHTRLRRGEDGARSSFGAVGMDRCRKTRRGPGSARGDQMNRNLDELERGWRQSG